MDKIFNLPSVGFVIVIDSALALQFRNGM